MAITYTHYTVCSKKVTPKFKSLLRHILSELIILLEASISPFWHKRYFNKIHLTVSEQHLFKKWNLKTEFFNMENTD